MKKIRFFLDPISDLEVFLNKMAIKGYRLNKVNNFIFDFEKTEIDYAYSTQFIGANTSKENNDYIRILRESGVRIFRAPLNQGNIAFGKFRFRPYANGDAKFANSFQGLNKEILIVENKGKKQQKLLTSTIDLAEQYRNIRNAYLQGFIMLFILFIFSAYITYKTNFEVTKVILSCIVGLLTLFIAVIILKVQKNYKKYKKESSLMD